MRTVFSSGRLLREVNFTYIVFILKEGEVSSFSNLRPISLCNLSYKISSKLIANRLRPFLDRFISSSQAAFVSGRWILYRARLLLDIASRRNQAREG